MRLMKDSSDKKSRVAITVWDRNNKKNSEGKYSTTFTVEDTTIDEVVKFIQEAIRQQQEA